MKTPNTTPPRRATASEISRAETMYLCPEISIDSEALAVNSASNGVWVQAWLFVPDAEVDSPAEWPTKNEPLEYPPASVPSRFWDSPVDWPAAEECLKKLTQRDGDELDSSPSEA